MCLSWVIKGIWAQLIKLFVIVIRRLMKAPINGFVTVLYIWLEWESYGSHEWESKVFLECEIGQPFNHYLSIAPIIPSLFQFGWAEEYEWSWEFGFFSTSRDSLHIIINVMWSLHLVFGHVSLSHRWVMWMFCWFSQPSTSAFPF